MPRFLKFLAQAAMFCCGACASLWAKPTIMFLYPAGGSQGSMFEVSAGALSPHGIKSASISGEGVTAELIGVEDLSKERLAAAARRDEARGMRVVKLDINISASAPVGVRDLRLIASDGSSNRFRFYVGEIPEVMEAEPNDSFKKAMEIKSLPVCINGQTYEADKDFYRFSLKAGQTVVFECLARNIKPYIPDAVPGWFQPLLFLYDDKGRQIAFADDYKISPDPVLIHKVARSGQYTLEVRDAMYRGRDDFVYRLRVGELPFVDAVFPNGGKLGKDTQLIVKGENLLMNKASVKNDDSFPRIKDFGVKNGKYFSNLVKFDVDSNEQIVLWENVGTPPKKGEVVPVPVSICGRIKNSGAVDWIRFKADRGEVLVFETFGRRLGSPVDTKISIFDPDNMRLLISNDDYEDASFGLITHHADSRIQYKFYTSKEYLLKIEDVESRGGVDFVYRLKIEKPKPDFVVRIMPDNPQITQGDYAPLKVVAFRKGGFTGDITVRASKLPEGYSAEPCLVEQGKTAGILKLIADAKVPMEAFNPQFTASAQIDGKLVSKPVEASEELMQAFFYTHTVPVDKISISVMPKAPFKVEWGELPQMPFNLQAGGTHSFPIKVIRDAGCKLPVRIRLLRACPGMGIRSVVIPPDKDSAMIDCTVPMNMSGVLEDVLLVMGEASDGKNTYQAMAPMVMRYRAVGK